MTTARANPADLDDPTKYTPLPEAEVFYEHTRRRKDPETGKEIVVHFDKAWLERYAAGSNERDAKGCPCTMSLGHTVDGAPEKDQPEGIGYWRKFRVAWSAAKKCWALFSMPYVQKGREEEAKTYPKVSIEPWRHLPVIDPIAIMRRTPELATQWTYAAQGDRWRFSMEDAGVDKLDPTARPSAAAPDQEFQDKFAACMAHHYPHLKAMHDKFAASLAAPGATMPEPSKNTTVDPAGVKDGVEKYSALEQEHKGLKDRFAAMEAANKADKDAIAELQKQLRHKERWADIEKDALKFEMDAAKEFEACRDLPADQYAAYRQRFANYKAKPVDPAAPLPALDTSGSAVGGGKTFDLAALSIANKFMADEEEKLRDLPYEERWAKARKFAMTGKAD